MIEFKDWKTGETEAEYLQGTKIAYISLGEEAYGLIVVTPWQSIHIEEIPQYGGVNQGTIADGQVPQKKRLNLSRRLLHDNNSPSFIHPSCSTGRSTTSNSKCSQDLR